MDPITLALLTTGINAGGNWLSNQISGGGDEKVNQYDKYQRRTHKQNAQNLQGLQGGYNNATGLLQKFLDPNSDVYQNFENQYLNNFEEDILPRIFEKFGGGFGAESGALSSSGFGQAVGGAARGLQTDLAAMKSGMQRNAISDFLAQYQQQNQNVMNAQPFGYRENTPPSTPFNISSQAVQDTFSNPSGGAPRQGTYNQGYNSYNAFKQSNANANPYQQTFAAFGM